MRLLITTPIAIAIDESSVTSVRAEDDSGSFGILKGHADLLTALNISIVSWHTANNRVHYCAVRRGVLSVTGGAEVAIATREAIAGDDLDRLEEIVLGEFRSRSETERASRTASLRLQMKAIRQIVQYLRPNKRSAVEDGS
jgi:F-type H+-transporting ATPase subunit epsilon